VRGHVGEGTLVGLRVVGAAVRRADVGGGSVGSGERVEGAARTDVRRRGAAEAVEGGMARGAAWAACCCSVSTWRTTRVSEG
jgi:hypothetical protein